MPFLFKLLFPFKFSRTPELLVFIDRHIVFCAQLPYHILVTALHFIVEEYCFNAALWTISCMEAEKLPIGQSESFSMRSLCTEETRIYVFAFFFQNCK